MLNNATVLKYLEQAFIYGTASTNHKFLDYIICNNCIVIFLLYARSLFHDLMASPFD